MAQCVEVNWIPLADGSNAVVLSPSSLPAADCGLGLLLSPQEFTELTAQAAPTPLTLTPEQGALVSSAICGVWFIAWAFRRFIQVLNVADE